MQKTPKPLKLFFSKIRSNFCSVESLLLERPPDILGLCETNMNTSVSSTEFSVCSYLPYFERTLMSTYMALVSIFAGISHWQANSLLSLQIVFYMCFQLSLVNSLSYLFFFNRSPSSHERCLLDTISDVLFYCSVIKLNSVLPYRKLYLDLDRY